LVLYLFCLRSTGEWYAEVQATRKVRKAESKNLSSTDKFLSNPEICETAGISVPQACKSVQFIRAFPTDGDMQGLGNLRT